MRSAFLSSASTAICVLAMALGACGEEPELEVSWIYDVGEATAMRVIATPDGGIVIGNPDPTIRFGDLELGPAGTVIASVSWGGEVRWSRALEGYAIAADTDSQGNVAIAVPNMSPEACDGDEAFSSVGWGILFLSADGQCERFFPVEDQGFERIEYVAFGPSGRLAVAGTSGSYAEARVHLLSIEDGDVVFHDEAGGLPTALAVADDGRTALVSLPASGLATIVRTFDEAGGELANATLDAEFGSAVDFTADGDIVLAGADASEGFVVKLDADLETVWTERIGSGRLFPYTIAARSDGSALVGGNAIEETDLDGATIDKGFIASFDRDGDQRLIAEVDCYIETVSIDKKGNMFVAGGFSERCEIGTRWVRTDAESARFVAKMSLPLE